MLGRMIILLVSLVLLVAHLTGRMSALVAFFSVELEPLQIFYMAAIPFLGVVGFYLLRDDR